MPSAGPWLRRTLPLALALAGVAVLGGYLYEQRAHIADSWSLDPGRFLAIAGLMVASLALRGVANRLFFGGLGVRAPFRDWFAVVTVTAFTNYLPLSAGLLAKAFFLKRVHALSYGRFAVGQAGLLLLVLATNGVAGLAALSVAGSDGLLGPVGAGFAAMVAAAGLLFLPESLARRLPAWLPWDAHAAPVARRAWPVIAALQLAILGATALGLWLAFAMGAGPVSLAACVIFSAAIVLTRVVSLTPGALGVREFLVGGLAWLTGFELRDAVIASTIVRVAEMAVVFALGAVFTWSLSERVAATYEPGADGGGA